jgi:hypothetical protein
MRFPAQRSCFNGYPGDIPHGFFNHQDGSPRDDRFLVLISLPGSKIVPSEMHGILSHTCYNKRSVTW